MAEQVFNATGKRKTSVARVRIKPGSGKIVVNGEDATAYFKRESAMPYVEQPLVLTDNLG